MKNCARHRRGKWWAKQSRGLLIVVMAILAAANTTEITAVIILLTLRQSNGSGQWEVWIMWCKAIFLWLDSHCLPHSPLFLSSTIQKLNKLNVPTSLAVKGCIWQISGQWDMSINLLVSFRESRCFPHQRDTHQWCCPFPVLFLLWTWTWHLDKWLLRYYDVMSQQAMIENGKTEMFGLSWHCQATAPSLCCPPSGSRLRRSAPNMLKCLLVMSSVTRISQLS